MRGVVGVLLFLTLTPVMAEIGEANAQRQHNNTLPVNELLSTVSSVLARLPQQNQPGMSSAASMLRRWSRQPSTSLGQAATKVSCPADQESDGAGNCVCKPDFVMVNNICTACPANSGTSSVQRNGWKDCVCKSGFTGLISSEVSECKPCDVDFFGVGGHCYPCGKFSTTNTTIGQSICMCEASSYSTGSKCEPCPAGSTSPLNSRSVGDCKCQTSGAILDSRNGTWTCVSASEVSRAKKLLNHLIEARTTSSQLCEGSQAPCYYANRIRVVVRWIQITVSMFAQTYTLFRSESYQCPSMFQLLAFILPMTLGLFDLGTDLLMQPVANVGFHVSYIIFGLTAAINDWRNLAHSTFEKPANIVLVEFEHSPNWAMLQTDCPAHSTLCKVALLTDCDAETDNIPVFNNPFKALPPNEIPTDDVFLKTKRVVDARPLDPIHSHLMRAAPFYLALASGISLTAVLATSTEDLPEDMQIMICLLAVVFCVGGNNLYYSIMFGNDAPVWVSSTLNILSGVAAVLMMSAWKANAVYMLLTLIALSTVYPLVMVATIQARKGCTYRAPLTSMLIVIVIFGLSVALSGVAYNE
eukprot:c16191_g1_i1.p1 GENE.c16191_g1_i1~~c16191_g1_i1.p1  ORF type:complete len:584 (+),score=116.65 c16191_g1_i1:27-1778(+)